MREENWRKMRHIPITRKYFSFVSRRGLLSLRPTSSRVQIVPVSKTRSGFVTGAEKDHHNRNSLTSFSLVRTVEPYRIFPDVHYVCTSSCCFSTDLPSHKKIQEPFLRNSVSMSTDSDVSAAIMEARNGQRADREHTDRNYHHNRMVTLANELLFGDDSKRGEYTFLLRSSPTLTNDALKVIRYFHSRKYGLSTNIDDGAYDTGALVAKQILYKLLQMEEESNGAQKLATDQMFVLVINGLSSTNTDMKQEYHKHAEDVLRRFQQRVKRDATTLSSLHPAEKQRIMTSHVIAFNMVLKSLSNVGTVQAAQRAEDMLRDMCEFHDLDPTGTVPRPDVVSFNTAIHAWAKAAQNIAFGKEENRTSDISCAERAEQLLRFMQAMHEASVDTGSADQGALSPDRTSYNSVINAWAYSCKYDTS